MEVCHDGLKLWYGTEDAPASKSFVAARQGISITVGVYPLHSANKVTVYYRSDKNRLVQSIAGILRHSDYVTAKQYFSVQFPPLLKPQKIEYLVTLSCAGRRVPQVCNTQQFPSSFIINDLPLSLASPPSTPKTPLHESLQYHRFPCNLNYLGTVQVWLQESPDIIGETPEGLRVNWSIKTGQVNGPKLNAIFGPHGGDHMTIRHDGIGIVGAYATLETVDGALIETKYSGVFELGQKGYQNFLKQQWPNAPLLRVTPRFLTEHPKYKWLNRLQCIGIGEVQMSDLLVIYDLYAL